MIPLCIYTQWYFNQMTTKTQEVKKIIEKTVSELSLKLPIVFSQKELSRQLQQMRQTNRITDETSAAIFKKTIPIPLKWNTNTEVKFLTFHLNKVQVIDMLIAFQPQYYFSHFSALYLHELTNHRPKEHFLSKEKTHTSIHSQQKIPEKIHQAFLKSHRKTNKYVTYQKIKINLIEKQKLNKVGVISKSLETDKEKQARIFFTSLERTLIDSLISPHYSGGIKTVSHAFYKSKINIPQLYKIYQTYSPFYPYWQSIGFLFYKLKNFQAEKKWSQYFSIPKIEFYFDKNFNENWSYDSKWKIHYPKGLFE